VGETQRRLAALEAIASTSRRLRAAEREQIAAIVNARGTNASLRDIGSAANGMAHTQVAAIVRRATTGTAEVAREPSYVNAVSKTRRRLKALERVTTATTALAAANQGFVEAFVRGRSSELHLREMADAAGIPTTTATRILERVAADSDHPAGYTGGLLRIDTA
jgi:hypothetical protein